jgi:hypothetical protein
MFFSLSVPPTTFTFDPEIVLDDCYHMPDGQSGKPHKGRGSYDPLKVEILNEFFSYLPRATSFIFTYVIQHNGLFYLAHFKKNLFEQLSNKERSKTRVSFYEPDYLCNYRSNVTDILSVDVGH